MQQRAGILVRLSAQDLDAAQLAATELGVPLDRLFSACALHEAANLPADASSWGPPPGRFPAAELLHLSFSPEEGMLIEKAAAAAFFLDPGGRRVPMNPPQFVATATLRLIQRDRASDLGTLRRLFFGPSTAEPARPPRPRPSVPAARAGAELTQERSPRTAEAPQPAKKPAVSKNDLRLAAVVGGATLLTLVIAVVFFGRRAPAPADVPTEALVPEVASADPAAPPESVEAPIASPEAEEEPFELPPIQNFSPEEIEQMRAELTELTRKFRETKGSAPKKIDTLLRNIYGRPHVSPDAQVTSTGPTTPKLLSLASYDRRYDAEILMAIADVESVYPVPPALVKGIIRRESNFNPKAVSVVGAVGLMQVMPFNAERVGLKERDLWVPEKNILAGVRLLAVLLKFYKGDVISALVAYNARPRDLFASVPQNGETPGYVAAVLASYEAFSGEPLRKQIYRNSRGKQEGEPSASAPITPEKLGVTQ